MKGLRIKPHRPLWSMLGMLLPAIAAALFVYGQQQHATRALRGELESVAADHRRLEHLNRLLAEENGELRRQITLLTRAQQVERIAYDRIDSRLRELQDEVHALEEEVAFYRGIVSSDRDRDIQVRSVIIDADGRERGFRFQIVLTRGGKGDKVITGAVRLSLSGEHQGRSHRFSFRELSVPATDVIEFRLKYFQRLQGHLILPDGFIPQRVHVRVDVPDEDPSGLERHFDWPALAS